MTGFTVHHSLLQEDNETLNAQVRQVYNILEELNSFLRNMPGAAYGQALPLWQAQQSTWDATYQDMATRLAASATASGGVGEIFLAGDNATARLMA